MDGHSIERIRRASFSHSVRGYDRAEVDQFLGEVADWLQTGGGDDPAAELVRTELERVGEQVGAILTEAHDAAEAIREDADAQARKHLVDANVTSESVRGGADEYAETTRKDADSYARKARADADAYAEQAREAADADAGDIRGDAQREAERIVSEANRRRAGVESVISDLEQRRDAVLAELERLASGLVGTATQHRGAESPPGAETEHDGAGDAQEHSLPEAEPVTESPDPR